MSKWNDSWWDRVMARKHTQPTAAEPGKQPAFERNRRWTGTGFCLPHWSVRKTQPSLYAAGRNHPLWRPDHLLVAALVAYGFFSLMAVLGCVFQSLTELLQSISRGIAADQFCKKRRKNRCGV